ncbi:hypothetical protein MGN70_013966 [Eutypa lata]|nr:hypothetical protein MGN70_013966 [Eutypa lata]
MAATLPALEQQQPVAVGDVLSKFEDFDAESVFDETEREAGSESCQNFVVEFGSCHARVARDLGPDDFKSILEDDAQRAKYPIRWINIWNTSKQDKAVEVIGEKYDFSERLRALMKMKPSNGAELQAKSSLRQRQAAIGAQKATPTGRVTSAESALERGEKASNTDSNSQPDEPPLKPERENLLDEDIRLYLLLKDTVNYFSIDHTERDTVLSFHEQPAIETAPSPEEQRQWDVDNLKSMRANMLSVLSQISTHDSSKRDKQPNPLTQSSIRKALQALEAKKAKRSRPIPPKDLTQILAQEGASNLFYYLFEDYAAASPFQEARDTLAELTPIVLQSDSRKMKRKTSEIIPRLHELSKELRELRHLFENYKNLIKKIMVTTKPEGATGDYPWSLGRTSSNLSFPTGPPEAFGEEARVVLAKSAMDRFDRLADRLEWVVLNTIQGHLEEITALSDTYFNLTQQKDSQATAKLNRSATLLAKLSVFFLPISFMTGYFGVEITDLNQYWTSETYWYSFAGIASISFLSLFFFGRMLMFFSDTLDNLGTKTGSLVKAGTQKVVGLPSRRKMKRDRDRRGPIAPDARDA